MLSKNIDMLLVGKNYLSFAMGLRLLRQGKKVLLVDDERFSYGQLYAINIGQLEKSYLQCWGQREKIGPLANIEKYLIRRPSTLLLGKKRIRLGESPRRNFSELARKLPFCFEQQGSNAFVDLQKHRSSELNDFDTSFESFCMTLAQILLENADTTKFNLKMFMQYCPEQLQGVFAVFFKKYVEVQGDERWMFRTFSYMIKGIYHFKLSFIISEFEMFHLLLCLLSPNYQLDYPRLMKDLGYEYQQLGGEFKQTVVSEWLFDKKRPWSVELASFEGVIQPKEIVLLGGVPARFPLSFFPEMMTYSCLKVKWELSVDTGFEQEIIFYSSNDKIGTDFPLWRAVLDGKQIHFDIVVVRQKGCKESFIQQEIRTILLEELAGYCAINSSDIVREQMVFGHEVWMVSGQKGPGQSAAELYQIEIKDDKSKLEQVRYYGPYQGGPLGALSTMMEINGGATDEC